MLQIKFVNLSKGPLWLVEPKYSIGASSEHPIRAALGEDHQADLLVSLDGVSISNVSDDNNIFLNGRPLAELSEEKRKLVHGDQLSIGGLELQLVDPKILKREGQNEQTSITEEETSWSLRALNHALANREFPLNESCTIGRSQSCGISLSVAHLSRKHAQLVVTPTGVRVEDLNSSNGTFVNGKKIQQANLRNGDELSFDTLKFKVIGPNSETFTDDSDKTTIRPVGENFKSSLHTPAAEKLASAATNAKVPEPKTPSKSKKPHKSASGGTLPAPRFDAKKAAIKSLESDSAKTAPKLSIVSEPQIIHDKSEDGVSSKVLLIGLLIFGGLAAVAYFLFFANA